MTTHTLLKARFATVRRDLDRVLAELTDDLLSWAPREGMRTVRGQLFEIIGKEIELLAYAKAEGKAEWQEIEGFGERESYVEGWKGIFAETRAGTLKYLDSLSESDLEMLICFPTDWWEGVGLTELPFHEVFRSIAAHEWYHTAQLVAYLQMGGLSPIEL